MVYCGKPSRGCQMCRTRRIKCDETKPTCNQCAKSRRQCPGYKDDFDLVFRNETEATERRARKANQKAIARMEKLQVEQGDKTAIGGVVAPPALPDDVKADHYFVANFVLLPRPGTGTATRGFFEYIMPLYKSASQSSHFKLAFEACSLALFHNRKKQTKKMETAARGRYTKALMITHKALQDPAHATSDLTLATILLLSLYENISAMQIGQLGWGSHVEGAVSIVKTRGRELLKTGMGQELFIAVRTQMIVHALSSGKPPIMGPEWWVNDAFNDWHGAQCQKLNIRVAELRAEVNRLMETVTRTPENIELMTHLIQRCQVVDQELVAWEKDLPDVFRWMTVTWVDDIPDGDYSKAEVFPGRVDAYQDLWVVSVWSMQRVSRVYLGSLIVRCAAWICSPVDYRTTPEFRTAQRTGIQLAEDIIASVPYQLGWLTKHPDLHPVMARSGFACGQDADPEMSVKGLPGYFLTWPLACVCGLDFITEDQRAWVKGRLEFVGNHAGVRYAHMLKNLDLRWPSMLIRKDGLMANPFPTGHNFEQLLRDGKDEQKPSFHQVVEDMPPAQQYALYKHLQTTDPPRAEAMKQAYEQKKAAGTVTLPPVLSPGMTPPSANHTTPATPATQTSSPAVAGSYAMSPAQQYELYQQLLVSDPPRAAEMKRAFEAKMAARGGNPTASHGYAPETPASTAQASTSGTSERSVSPAQQYELYQQLLRTDPPRAAEMGRAFGARSAGGGAAPSSQAYPTAISTPLQATQRSPPVTPDVATLTPTQEYELYQCLLRTDPPRAEEMKRAFEARLAGAASTPSPTYTLSSSNGVRGEQPYVQPREQEGMTSAQPFSLYQSPIATDPQRAEAMKREYEAKMAAGGPVPYPPVVQPSATEWSFPAEQPPPMPPATGEYDHLTPYQQMSLYRQLVQTDPSRAEVLRRAFQLGEMRAQ